MCNMCTILLVTLLSSWLVMRKLQVVCITLTASFFVIHGLATSVTGRITFVFTFRSDVAQQYVLITWFSLLSMSMCNYEGYGMQRKLK